MMKFNWILKRILTSLLVIKESVAINALPKLLDCVMRFIQVISSFVNLFQSLLELLSFANDAFREIVILIIELSQRKRQNIDVAHLPTVWDEVLLYVILCIQRLVCIDILDVHHIIILTTSILLIGKKYEGIAIIQSFRPASRCTRWNCQKEIAFISRSVCQLGFVTRNALLYISLILPCSAAGLVGRLRRHPASLCPDCRRRKACAARTSFFDRSGTFFNQMHDNS
jgi:hypothetical protein